MSDWIALHRNRWSSKPSLRRYYEQEIFRPLLAAINGARDVLEVGAGPGFLRKHAAIDRRLVSMDVEPESAAEVVCDIHALPFVSGVFDATVGVDCLHHFARPALALNEIARVLRPGGTLALVEPWTGALGRLFYRFLHHEDCYMPRDPLGFAFPSGKEPMDGNAMLPQAVLCGDRDAFAAAVPDLSVVRVKYFGIVSYVLTGGFQRWGFPAGLVMALSDLEAHLPAAAMRQAGLRALFVLKRN